MRTRHNLRTLALTRSQSRAALARSAEGFRQRLIDRLLKHALRLALEVPLAPAGAPHTLPTLPPAAVERAQPAELESL